jgi:hypothetical protein
MNFEEYKQAIVDLALSRLQSLHWFKGLVTSSIRESWGDGESVEDAALQVELETAHCHRPGGLFGDCGDGLGLK